MKKETLRIVLLVLAIFGTIIPYSFLALHVLEHGTDVTLMYQEIAASRLGSFGWVDVIISAVTLVIFVLGTKIVSGRQTIAVVGSTLLIGVSAGLPLFLYFLLGSKYFVLSK